MNTKTTLSRRMILRGLGTTLALPFLESMIPSRLFGASTTDIVAKAAAGPRRLAWLYVPNGIDMQTWTPADYGANYTLSPTLSTLADYRDRMTVITGLVCDKANPNGDGPGDHARAQAAYLTGVQPNKTEGANLRAGISADQAAADRIGHLTKFPSLELGMEEGKQIGRCDSGYSCAYIHNLSWRNEKTPMVKDCDPQSVFDRLFSNGDPRETAEARARRENDRKSILDFVMADANAVQKNRLASTDREKLDEYLTSVREIEQRMQRMATEAPPKLPAGAVRPEAFDRSTVHNVGVSSSSSIYDDHINLMIDMTVLAFQADLTRVITLPFADEQSNQSYPWAGANAPHHGTSHHMGDPAKQALLAKINVYHLQKVKYLLGKLDAIKEGNGSVLDNSLIAYGSGNSDGNRHNHDDLPLILLGKAGGTINTGRHIKADNVPINNLWLSMLDHAGASDDKLGDSTGKLPLT